MGFESEVEYLGLHQLGYPATTHELFKSVNVHRSGQSPHITSPSSVSIACEAAVEDGVGMGSSSASYLESAFCGSSHFTLPTATVASFTSCVIVFTGAKTIPASAAYMACSSSSSNVTSYMLKLATGPSFRRNPHLEKHLEIVHDCT